MGVNNSQATSNTYDNIRFTSASGLNNTVGCSAISSLTNVARYGFNDEVSSGSAPNRHTAPDSRGSGTLDFIASNSSGSGFLFVNNLQATLTVNSTTPSVAGKVNFETINSSATLISDFTNGVPGQIIYIRCLDNNTTIQHNGATIVTFNGGDVKLRNGFPYFFRKEGVLWRELLPPQPLGVTANVGDADKTLQTRVNEETQIWTTTLTADRTVTLSATGGYAGAKFRIARPAAGAFNLNVGSGPLKALPAGSWCDVEYNGSAWVLTAYGAL
jgi:hypothetical protein